jgi:K+-sensing histidine kinase KdpD
MKDERQRIKLPAVEVPALLRLGLRYGSTVLAVAAGYGVWRAITESIGPGLPPFITFYPLVMVVALPGGLGPGLLATTLGVLVVGVWIMPPVGQLSVASPVDGLALALFAGMGLFISAVAELYRRNREKAAAYDREIALREGEEALRRQAELIDPVRARLSREMPRGA